MAFDFPATPAVDQVFAPAGGPIYRWNGSAWARTPGGRTARPRNYFINPAFQISQENVNALGSVSNFFPADNWQQFQTTAGVYNVQRIATVTPNGSQYRVRQTVGTAEASIQVGGQWWFGQYLEGIRIASFRWGTPYAKPIVFRFGFKAPAGTYCVALRNIPNARSYLMPFDIPAAQAGVDTEQVFAIPGDTAGTWPTDTTPAMSATVAIAGGPNFFGAPGWQYGNCRAVPSITNGGRTAGLTYEYWDMGLYLDPDDTGVPPPWQFPDEVEQLAACRRHYGKYLGAHLHGQVAAAASGLLYHSYQFQTQMREVPAVTFINELKSNSTAGTTLNAANIDGVSLSLVALAAGTFYSRDAIIVDARL